MGDRSAISRGLELMALVQMVTQPEEAIRTVDEAIPLALEAGPAHLYADLLDFKSHVVPRARPPGRRLQVRRGGCASRRGSRLALGHGPSQVAGWPTQPCGPVG